MSEVEVGEVTLPGDGWRPSRRPSGGAKAEVRHSGGLGAGSRRRCARHGLAVGADGRCVLCRRDEAAQREETGRARAKTRRVVIWASMGLVLVAAGLLVWQRIRSLSESAQPIVVPSEVEAQQAPSDEAVARSELERAQPNDSYGSPAPRTADAPPRIAEVPPLEDAEARTAAREAAAADGSIDAAFDAPSDAGPSQGELEAALRATPVILYATTWCPVCAKARAFLTANHLSYREVDVDRVSGGWDAVERLARKRAVPVIVVDGEALASGLDQAGVMKAVVSSVERRLGVTGIQLKQL